MAIVGRAGEYLARSINRRTALKQAAVAVFGAVAAFAVEGVRRSIAEASKIYALFGATERIQVRYPDCGHDFPPEVREEAYRFIEATLASP